MNNSVKIPYCPQNAVEVFTVQNVDGIKGLNNCFVCVTDINTTFFVDNQHRIIEICAKPVYIDNYDYVKNPLKLREQICFDFARNLEIVYNAEGGYRLINMIGDNNE